MRLGERVRQREGPSYRIDSSLNVSRTDRAASWTINVSAAPANMEKLEAAIFEEIERALKDGFSANEVTKAAASADTGRSANRTSQAH